MYRYRSSKHRRKMTLAGKFRVLFSILSVIRHRPRSANAEKLLGFRFFSRKVQFFFLRKLKNRVRVFAIEIEQKGEIGDQTQPFELGMISLDRE